MYCVFGRGKTIVRELQVAFDFDETHSAQIGEMAGHSRLWKLENLHDIADTELARSKEAQDSDPRRIGKAFEHPIEVMDSRRLDLRGYFAASRFPSFYCHIWHNEYNMARRI